MKKKPNESTGEVDICCLRSEVTINGIARGKKGAKQNARGKGYETQYRKTRGSWMPLSILLLKNASRTRLR